MQIDVMLQKFKKIYDALWNQWPTPDKEKRIFAQTIKIGEEFGELSEIVLANSKFQKSEKLAAFNQKHIAEEWADVFSTLILLGIELDIDIPQAIEEKLSKNFERFKLQ